MNTHHQFPASTKLVEWFKMNDIYKQFENVSIWKSYRNQKGNIKPCQMMSNVQFLKSAFEKIHVRCPKYIRTQSAQLCFIWWGTSRKTQMSPENRWLEDVLSYWNSAFLGDICSSGCKFIHGKICSVFTGDYALDLLNQPACHGKNIWSHNTALTQYRHLLLHFKCLDSNRDLEMPPICRSEATIHFSGA